LQQVHTTPEAIALSNRMKELIRKNRFKHRLGPGGYKAAISLWTKKEQGLHEVGIPDPLEGCTLSTRNWICGRSRIDDNRQLVTSNSDIIRVVEIVKDLITKDKAAKFKLQSQKDHLSIALKTEKHRGCTRAISSIASWKKGFMEDIHMYKKLGRHDTNTESANNDKEQFASQFFNFMRKHPNIIITQMSVLQINLDTSTGLTPSSAGSTPKHQKYHVDVINKPNPCTLLYVKGS
jgi:hypothetical protein